jgi:hypothetical protein
MYDAANGGLVADWTLGTVEGSCDEAFRMWRVGDVNGNGQDDFIIEVNNREVHLFDRLGGPLLGDIAVWTDDPAHVIRYQVAYLGAIPAGTTTKLCIVRTIPDAGQPMGQDNAFYLYDLGTTPSAVGAEPAPAISPARVGSSRPNPSRGLTRIPYVLSRPGTVELKIVDVAGRVVRSLTVAAVSTSGELWWDGTDDAGRPAGSGTFFYQVRVDGLVQGGKLTLIR